MATTTSDNNSENLDQSMLDIADAFRNGVTLKDRKYLLKTYKQCFVGSEAVDFLVNSGMADNRKDAVVLGKALSNDLHIFEHVARDHEFADEQLFYRFIGENERGAVAIDEATGKKVGWSDFLAPVTGDYMKNASEKDSFLPHLPLPDFEAVSGNDVHVASKVWPLDEHNTTLLDHVHPAKWKDPAPNNKDGSSHYDLVVIGGGTAGLVTAAGSAGVGAKVAMIEEHMLGGDCLNVGCVPSKTIIHSANLAHTIKGDLKRNEEAGIYVDPSAVRVDFEKVMERVRKIRANISHHDSAERYSQELGVEVFIGR